MQVAIRNKDIFPAQVKELLEKLFSVGFFEESMVIGSWVMPLYQEAFGINYALRTLDIDFAVKFVHPGKDKKIDLDKIITDLGYIPITIQSGIRKFTRDNFTVEFIAQRRGGRSDEMIKVVKWNITAAPLPFVNILLNFPFTADFGDFKVRAPLPEAFFIHKLITAQRRPVESKRVKDLEQCSIVARQLDAERLKHIVESLKFSKKAQKALRTSCETIDFPLHRLNLE